MKKISWLLLCSIILIILSGCSMNEIQNNEQQQIKSSVVQKEVTFQDISSKELRGFITSDDILLIDVREPYEFEEGYISNSINIPLGQLDNRLSELSKDQSIVVYCRSGRRSAAAAEIFVINGFLKVYNLKGGILQWPYDLVKPNLVLH
ncbi:rhodanese-like domain-containing protein [Desulfotomaculum sp. 1211_IL3151]|uniref:rhodanese-like domain-containing protein n=1 Tax=Desulfotomaculum sp. 1211_IL3151 TaxID=3084055 RepID=UPI002FD896D6